MASSHDRKQKSPLQLVLDETLKIPQGDVSELCAEGKSVLYVLLRIKREVHNRNLHRLIVPAIRSTRRVNKYLEQRREYKAQLERLAAMLDEKGVRHGA